MGIIKDGSVFRIPLESGCLGPETRISFAVNSHGDVKRPRLEINLGQLRAVFMDAIIHMNGKSILGEKNWSPEYRRIFVIQLERFVREAVAFMVSGYDERMEIPHEVKQQFEALAQAWGIPIHEGL